MPSTQQNRFIAIKTELGEDNFLLKDFSYSEQLGRLFQIDAELYSEDAEIDFDDVVGHKATIRLDLEDDKKRYFSGVVSRLVQVSNEGKMARYRATIVPWFWLLTRTADCRIFQDKSIPDIIEAVFEAHGFDDYELKLSGQYEPREYCVQYRETDFNFVSRLMEQYGIYYYFEHEDDKSTLVLADSISAHAPFPGYEEIEFHELEEGATEREAITDWTVEKELQPVASALNDFDFKKPKSSLRVSSNVTRNYGQAQFEIYDYPGEYVEHSDAQRLSDVRLEELQTQYEIVHGQASARGLAAGYTFELTDHPRDDQNREYLVIAQTLHADAGAFESSDGGGKEFFSCNFTAIDKAHQFRPARATPKPLIQGPQTAIVVGPSGEKNYTDEYGRVKVQFHWDRYGKSDENSSCWVRVSQNWAGKTWGAMFIPHLGQEVIVESLEGDPDRPIITGRVYNADQMPPLELPSHKNKSVIRDDFGNQIMFDATEGDEHISIYSPHHRSTMDIGRSVKMKTESQLQNITMGNSFTVDVGQNLQVYCGLNGQVYGGAYGQAVVGGQVTFLLGGAFEFFACAKATVDLSAKYEFTRGFKYSNVGGQQLESGSDDYYKHSEKNIVIDADKTLALVGGNADHAIIKMDETKLKVSFGVGNSKASADVARKAKIKAALGVSVGLVAAAALAAGEAVASSYAINNSGSNLPPTDPTGADPNQSVPDVSEDKMKLWGSILGGVCLIGAGVLIGLGRSINKVPEVDPNTRVHTDVHSEVELKDTELVLAAGKSKITIMKDGQILIENDEGSGMIKIFSKDKIVLNSQAEVQIICTGLEAKKGTFDSKNIKDLG
jgi:type VI secretion system secreted protein VgrG